MRAFPISLVAISALILATGSAQSQSTARVFNMELGIPVSELPTDQWVDPACGTDGGPPSIELESFADFANCPVEPDTGLHEVWFIYDDEWEYIARAYRDPAEIGRYSANVFYGQPIITSLLIDDAARVRGYRVITDPRAADDVRLEAHLLLHPFRTVIGDAAWQCEDLPRAERESSVYGDFIKTDCLLVTDQLYAKIEARLLRKPGQDFLINPPESYFEGSARLEVYDVEVVSGQPCCPEAERP